MPPPKQRRSKAIAQALSTLLLAGILYLLSRLPDGLYASTLGLIGYKNTAILCIVLIMIPYYFFFLFRHTHTVSDATPKTSELPPEYPLHHLSNSQKRILREFMEADEKIWDVPDSPSNFGLVKDNILYVTGTTASGNHYGMNTWAFDYLKQHPEVLTNTYTADTKKFTQRTANTSISSTDVGEPNAEDVQHKVLKNLASDEKSMLLEYVQRDVKTLYRDALNGTASGLKTKGVLFTPNPVTTVYHNAYTIHDWAWEAIHKHPKYLKGIKNDGVEREQDPLGSRV